MIRRPSTSPAIRRQIGSDTDDDSLVQQSQHGSREATEELLRRHYARILAVCRRTMGSIDGAEDAAQNALISVARGLVTFDRSAKFTPWVHRIAVNAAIDELRRHQRRRTDEIPPEVPDTERSIADTHADRNAIEAAIATLSPDHRTVLVLREFGQYEYAEIAERLNLPIGTVRSRIARARSELLAALKMDDTTQNLPASEDARELSARRVRQKNASIEGSEP